MSSQRPFRTALHIADAKHVQAFNEREDRTHGQACEPTREAINRLREQKTANSARISSWTQHPDERVPIQLIEEGGQGGYTPETPQYWRDNSALLRNQLYRRAIRQADQEGLLWTPLLDKIATFSVWTRTRTHPDLDYETSKERARRLKAWIQQADKPRELEKLLSFQFPHIAEMVAEHSRVWSWSLMKTVVEEKSTVAATRMVQNPRLPSTLQERLWKTTSRKLDKIQQQIQQKNDKVKLWPWTELMAEMGASWQRPGPAFTELEQLIERLETSSGGHRHSNLRTLLEAFQRFGEHLDAQQLNRLVRALPASEVPQWVGSRWVGENTVVQWLAQHPAANEQVWTTLVEKAPGSRNLQQLFLKIEEARKTSSVRKHLLRSTHPEVSHEIAEHAAPEEQKIQGQAMLEALKTSLEAGDEKRVRERINATLNLDHLRVDDLVRLYEMLEESYRNVRDLIRHPSATPQLYRTILEATDKTKIRILLAQHPDVPGDDECFQYLQRCRDPKILQGLCRFGPTEHLRDSFNRLRHASPGLALQVLRNPSFNERIQYLEEQDLIPLLETEELENRRAVLRALGRTQHSKTTESPQPSSTTGRQQ